MGIREYNQGTSPAKVVGWMEERLKFKPLLKFLSEKTVPQHKHSFWYLFGGLSLFFFAIQIITGMLLLLYYSPTPNTAHESITFIITQVRFGWLIRSVHSWSSNLMIFCLLIHFFSAFLMKAYRKPRELMWISGVILLLLVLGFGFTGYLLPWDTTAYFATQIGTEIPRSIPVVGDLIVNILRGGEYIAEESLKRLFALHVVIFPIISLLLVLFHLILNQVHGTSTPLRINAGRKSIQFFPNYIFRDFIAWVGASIVLVWLCLLLPVHIGPKADPFSSAPTGIKPEWYFLALYETLRVLPGTILGLPSESFVNIVIGTLGILLTIVPFLDRNAAREEPSPIFTWIGVAAITYLAVMISLAYLT